MCRTFLTITGSNNNILLRGLQLSDGTELLQRLSSFIGRMTLPLKASIFFDKYSPQAATNDKHIKWFSVSFTNIIVPYKCKSNMQEEATT